MFYPEITKIIEAGLDQDTENVKTYALQLAKQYALDGDKQASKEIQTILLQKGHDSAIIDELVTPPDEPEVGTKILNIDYKPENPNVVLSVQTIGSLVDFENSIKTKVKLDRLGMPCNMSLLMHGPSGCGKTSTANYLANKLELPLIKVRLDKLVSATPENIADHVKSIFDYANCLSSVLFLDEFDAIAKAYDDTHVSGELKHAAIILLQNIDAYCRNNGILIAATSHLELLNDSTRERFQTIIELPKPENHEIELLFHQITSTMDMSHISQKQLSIVTKQLKGLSYSDIQTLTQNAIKQTILRNEQTPSACDFMREIAIFKHGSEMSQEELIQYFSKCGFSQRAIAEYFQVSQRQIRNCLDKEKE